MEALPNEIWLEIIKASKNLIFIKRMSGISKKFKAVCDQHFKAIEQNGNKIEICDGEVLIIGDADRMGVPNYHCKEWCGDINTNQYPLNRMLYPSIRSCVHGFQFMFKDINMAYDVVSQMYYKFYVKSFDANYSSGKNMDKSIEHAMDMFYIALKQAVISMQ